MNREEEQEEQEERLVVLNDEKVVEALKQIGNSVFCPEPHRSTYERVASLPPTRPNPHYRMTMLFMLVVPSATDLHIFLRPAFELCPAKMLDLATKLEPLREKFCTGEIIEPEFCTEALNTYNGLVVDESNCECRIE